MDYVTIRQYRKDDREFVRNIAWDTAFIGRPADIFFAGRNILTDFLTLYFTDFEPESCFVAENQGRVVGYLTGAKSKSILSGIFQFKIMPCLLIRAILGGEFLKKKNIIFFFNCLFSFFIQEFNMPDFSKEYPAALHINVDKDFRNLKLGSRLMWAYLNFLTENKIPGVSLATMTKEGAEFFQKQGFSLLYAGRRSYFRYILHLDLPIYIYGKRLP